MEAVEAILVAPPMALSPKVCLQLDRPRKTVANMGF